MSRAFIAVNLPQNIKEKLVEFLEKLQKSNSSLPIKWVKLEGLHITLHFLGWLDNDMIERVGENIQEEVKKYKSPNLILGEFGAFPNLERPRVVFIETEEVKSNILASLRKDLGQRLEKLEIEVDHRSWKSHITLGRVKGKCQIQKPKQELERLQFKIENVDLMKSELFPDGA